jgi:hypothetical protein
MRSGVSLTMQAAKRATLGSVAICAATTVHHIYGAYIYHTLWRFHAAVISALATALIAASLLLLRKHSDDAIGSVASWTFMTVTFFVPLLGFGVFEGVYNHALKVALYFAHTSPVLMARLFPPSTYEMPNDAFFEVTGVMQVIPGVVTGYYLYRFVQNRNEPPEVAYDSQIYAD